MKQCIKLGFLFIGICFVLNSCCKCKEPTPTVPETPKTGSVVFWTPNLAVHGNYVNVTINGLTRTITANWVSPPPNCLSTNGVAYFNLEAGTYDYSTVDYFGFTSKGKVTFVANDCNKQRIE